jgi:cyclic beta-1,2-glucan synthetase
MLLNARIAAVHLGLISLSEFVFATQQTLNRLQALRKHKGHLFNWYSVVTLEPLAPLFVSTVDSGNLAASLWTLKQAATAFAAEPPLQRGLTPSLSTDLTNIAEACDQLVRNMDFRFLYNPRKKVLSVGFDLNTGQLEPSGYTLLASESRTATFIAIAKGDIPQKAWFHLGRAHSLTGGEPVLISWTGTLFEYLMPALWMRSHPETIIHQTMRAVVRIQREYARNKGVPWGISESAWLGPSGDGYGYAPFGIPGLATKPLIPKSLVISPYSSFLATCVDPVGAAENLTRMKEFGWLGRYGFYESVDYSQAGGKVIPIWMAHHQGMSLISIVNLLHDSPFHRYFHAEPQVLATELLLHERVPAVALVEVDQTPIPVGA